MAERVLLSFDESALGDLPWFAALQRNRPTLQPPPLRDDVRAAACREWEDRAAAEYVGVMIVRRLHGLLVDLNAPADLQAFALTMMLQEQEHAGLCMAAARSLGSDGAISFELPQLQQARTPESVETQLLKMLATTFLVGEVTAFALLSHGVRHLPPSGYRETLREILRDEASHARIGQALLRALRDRPDTTWARYPGDAVMRSWVAEAQADLRGRDVVEHETAALHRDPEAAAQLAAVGIPDSQPFRAAYLTALQREVPAALAEVIDVRETS